MKISGLGQKTVISHLSPDQGIKLYPWHNDLHYSSQILRHIDRPESQNINDMSVESRNSLWFGEAAHHCRLGLEGAVSRKGWPSYWAGLNKHWEKIDERRVRLNVTDLIYSFRLNCVVPQFHVSAEDAYPWPHLESVTAERSGSGQGAISNPNTNA